MSLIYVYASYEKQINDLFNCKPATVFPVEIKDRIKSHNRMGYCEAIVGEDGAKILLKNGYIDSLGNITSKGRSAVAQEKFELDKCPFGFECRKIDLRPEDWRDFREVSEEEFSEKSSDAYIYRHVCTAREVAELNGLVSDSEEIVYRCYEAYGGDDLYDPIVTRSVIWKYGNEINTLDRIRKAQPGYVED